MTKKELQLNIQEQQLKLDRANSDNQDLKGMIDFLAGKLKSLGHQVDISEDFTSITTDYVEPTKLIKVGETIKSIGELDKALNLAAEYSQKKIAEVDNNSLSEFIKNVSNDMVKGNCGSIRPSSKLMREARNRKFKAGDFVYVDETKTFYYVQLTPIATHK